MQTHPANLKTLERQWHVIDADGLVLGRVATKAARLLMGKHRPTYTTFLDTGDHVVVVNAGRVKLTGRKEEQKTLPAAQRLRGRPARRAREGRAGAPARSASSKKRCAACCPRPRWAMRCTGS